MINVAHFYSPSGNVYTQEKLHITPSEREHWGILPGNQIKVFETPIGRLAIVICYDIEFPELARILVDHGVDIILNPFATDERKSYLRVRYCAQARAVENMVYVVMSGNVGGLSRSPSMFLNFGQATICTPSDFAFPMNGIAAEGIVNTQTVVIADLDLGALDIQRQSASVRPLLDRRHDLYELHTKIPVEHITVL
jgi:predicted amidohydrolase